MIYFVLFTFNVSLLTFNQLYQGQIQGLFGQTDPADLKP